MSLQVANPPASARAPRGQVDLVGSVSSETTEEFLTIYKAAFEPLITRSPARQWLTDEEFRHDMADESVKKFVARSGEGEIMALAFMSTDLSTVPWISEPFFAHRFPDHYARGAIYYFGAMLVRPERQGGPWAKYLLDHIFHFIGERRGIAAFDCCGFNVDTVALPDLVERSVRHLVKMDMELLDRQEYFAAVVEGFK